MWRKSLVSVGDWEDEVFVESLEGFSSSASILVIADWKRGVIFLWRCPLLSRQVKRRCTISRKSTVDEFWYL